MAALSIFSKICQKEILFGRYFLTPQTPGYCFINVRNMRERQRSSGKFRLHKHLLTINSPLKMLPCHFRYFHCSNFKMTFDKFFLKSSCHFYFFQISTMSQNFSFIRQFFFFDGSIEFADKVDILSNYMYMLLVA